MEQINVILKVFMISLLGSLVIKYLSPNWGISATNINGLLGISVPPLVMGILLFKRQISDLFKKSEI